MDRLFKVDLSMTAHTGSTESGEQEDLLGKNNNSTCRQLNAILQYTKQGGNYQHRWCHYTTTMSCKSKCRYMRNR